METLRGVFPLVPAEVLERVLDICDQSVEAASDWLLENDWHELIHDERVPHNSEGRNDDDERVAEREHLVGTAMVELNAADESRSEEERVTHTDNDAPQIADHSANADRNGSAPAVATASRASLVARALTSASATSPLSAQLEQRGLTMAISTASRMTNGHHSNGLGGEQIRHHHSHHHVHRHGHHRNDDDDQEYDSAGDPDIDSDEGDEEEEDEEEDEDDEDDEGDDTNSYYDSSDESYFHSSIPQLTKRVKIVRDTSVKDLGGNEHFWASFDGNVVPKTLIELLNTTLTKLAHSSVTLLSKSSRRIAEDEARNLLKSVLVRAEEIIDQAEDIRSYHSQPTSSLSRILNSSPSETRHIQEIHVGQKRKRVEDTPPIGFFAHFFGIGDLDMVWRSILHAHLFNGRFGHVIEFHTASTGVFTRRDFDELMHVHTNITSNARSALGASSAGNLRCCLLLPCEATEDEIFRVGKHLHTLLKVPGSLYYRTLDCEQSTEGENASRDGSSAYLLNEDGKLTEESFRRFARIRIKKEEVEPTETVEKDVMGADHFLAYQPQRKVDYCLQYLEKNSWVRRVSD